MLGLIGLAKINQRLQEILACYNRPFCGLTIILFGDPYYLQPVAGKFFYILKVDQPNLINRKSQSFRPAKIGSNLFSQFVFYELVEQMRKHDQTHIALLDRLRNPAKLLHFAVI